MSSRGRTGSLQHPHPDDAADDAADVAADDAVVAGDAEDVGQPVAGVAEVGGTGEEAGPEQRGDQRPGQHRGRLLGVESPAADLGEHQDGAGDEAEPGEQHRAGTG